MEHEAVDLTPTLAEASLPKTAGPLPAELQEAATPVQKLKRIDEARDSFPGEHWLVLALGISVWHFTRHNRHALVRLAGSFAATALVARAASGRDGLSKMLRYTPFGRGVRSCPPCEAAGSRR